MNSIEFYKNKHTGFTHVVINGACLCNRNNGPAQNSNSWEKIGPFPDDAYICGSCENVFMSKTGRLIRQWARDKMSQSYYVVFTHCDSEYIVNELTEDAFDKAGFPLNEENISEITKIQKVIVVEEYGVELTAKFIKK